MKVLKLRLPEETIQKLHELAMLAGYESMAAFLRAILVPIANGLKQAGPNININVNVAVGNVSTIANRLQIAIDRLDRVLCSNTINVHELRAAYKSVFRLLKQPTDPETAEYATKLLIKSQAIAARHGIALPEVS